VSVANEGAAAEAALFSMDHADVGIRLESLWRRQLLLTIALAGLDMTTSSAGEGGAGLAALSVPSTFVLGSVEVRVGLIRLERGRLRHRDPVGAWALEARGIEAEGRSEPPALRLSVRVESLRVESPAGEERVERLRVEGRVQPGEIRLAPSRLRWQGHEIRLSGHLTQPGVSSEIYAAVRGELPLAAVGRRLRAPVLRRRPALRRWTAPRP
jgi:hypothetical protein